MRDMSIQLSCVSQPASNCYAIFSVCSATALQPGQCAQQLATALVYLVCVQCYHSLSCHDSSVIQRAIHCVRMGPGLRQCLEASPGQCSFLCWMHSGRHYLCSLVTAARCAPFKLAFGTCNKVWQLQNCKCLQGQCDYQFSLCEHMGHVMWS